MAEAPINPIVPNMSNQELGIAGSKAVVFTATDKKVIEERGGNLNPVTSFLDLFREKPLAPKVENEETAIHPEVTTKELEGRQREHNRMIKYAAITPHRDRVEITGRLPDEVVMAADDKTVLEVQDIPADLEKEPPDEITAKTGELAKELNISPANIFDRFKLEQKELYSLILRIKELHMKRLFTGNPQEFIDLTNTIEQETLSAGRPEERDWLKKDLAKLTVSAAQYKLGLIKSLQSLHVDEEQAKHADWLENIIQQNNKLLS